MWNRVLSSAAAIVALAGIAGAQDLPQTTIRFIGNTSNTYVWSEAERNFIEKTVPEASKGRVKIEGVPHDQAGLRGPEILGLLQNGTLQFASCPIITILLSFRAPALRRLRHFIAFSSLSSPAIVMKIASMSLNLTTQFRRVPMSGFLTRPLILETRQ